MKRINIQTEFWKAQDIKCGPGVAQVGLQSWCSPHMVLLLKGSTKEAAIEILKILKVFNISIQNGI